MAGYGKKTPAGPSPLDLRMKLLASARGGKVLPAYLLYGDENYLVEDTARRLIDLIIPAEQREFGMEVLSGPSVSISAACEALRALPLFGCRRVVWLRQCALFGSAGRAEAIRQQLPGKEQGTTLLITEGDLDKRFSLYRELQSRRAVYEFPRLAETNDGHLRSLYAMVAEKLSGDGREISRETFLYLVQLVGTDLRTLIAEIEKLSLHAGSRRRIEVDDIDLLVTPSRETAGYQLAEAVAAGDLARSLTLLRRLLGRNEEPLRILGGLLSRVRYLLQAREAIESGAITRAAVHAGFTAFRRALESVPQTVREAFPNPKKRYNLFRAHPYVAFKTFEEAVRIPSGVLRQAFGRVVRTDGELKGGRRSKAEALEDLTISLCRLLQPSPR